MKTILTEKRFFEWYEDDVSVTLRSKGASYGGGQRVFSSDIVGSLCADDRKGINNQYVADGKLIVEWKN